MALSAEFAEHVQELFSSLGRVRIRRMFGGAGIYHEDVMFAIVVGEILYLKTDDENRPDFEAEGLEAFRYDTSRGKRVSMSYYRAPDECMDSAALMQPWARKAVAAALRGARNKTPKNATRPDSTKRAATKVTARKSPAREPTKEIQAKKKATR